MWKIVLLTLITSNCLAQFRITPNQGRWCITNYEDNKVLNKIYFNLDSLYKERGTKIELLREEVGTYKKDSTNYIGIITKTNEISNNIKEENKELKSQVKKTKLENFILKIAIVIVIVVEIIKK